MSEEDVHPIVVQMYVCMYLHWLCEQRDCVEVVEHAVPVLDAGMYCDNKVCNMKMDQLQG